MENPDINFEIRPDWPERKRALTSEARNEIIDTCLSFITGEFKMREKYDLAHEELTDLLLDDNVERCPHCRNFTDSHSCIHPDTHKVDGHCTNCRPQT